MSGTLQESFGMLEKSYKILEESQEMLKGRYERLNKENKILKASYETLDEEYQILDASQKGLEKKYKELEESYKELDESYKELDESYKENAIIESMNEMKQQYDHLVLNSISLQRYKHLENKYNQEINKGIAVSVFLDHVLKKLKSCQDLSTQSSSFNCKLQLEIIMAKELLSDL
jgi:chromosome segregation ATPase